MRLSAVMIARNEQHNIERCFGSVWAAVDEIVLIDTGSRDQTVAVARDFAQRRGNPRKLVVGYFKWRDDWAAARNYADSLASGDWLLNMDLDEALFGGPLLRRMAQCPPPGTVAFALRLSYPMGDPTDRLPGEPIDYQQETDARLARAGLGYKWFGIVDEKRRFIDGPDGDIAIVPPRLVRIVENRGQHSYSELRERRARQEPDSSYAAHIRALQAENAGERDRAIAFAQEAHRRRQAGR